MEVKENVVLKNFTTMRVGGPARFFTCVKNTEELKEAIVFAKKNKIPYFILGGGSNIIVSDEGYKGLVIKMEIKGITISESTNYTNLQIDTNKKEALVTAGAGEDWDEFVERCVLKNLYGLENLSYIPGTVGATPIQNVGAYGVEVSDTIFEVHTFNAKTLKEQILKNEDCVFGYRDSVFKKEHNKHLIITAVSYLLKKDATVNCEYKDLREYFCMSESTNDTNLQMTTNKRYGVKNYDEKITARDVRDAIVSIRKNKLPDPREIGTVGSFFKNPIISQEHYSELKKHYSDIPGYGMSESTNDTNLQIATNTNDYEGVKVPLAWILDHICGLRGIKEGAVGLYEKQPLSVVHFGGGSADEIMCFAKKVKKEVKEKTGITIEREVVLVD